MKPLTQKRILFFAHSVTAAHFTRPLRFVEGLDASDYQIFFATSAEFKKMLPPSVQFIEMSCIDKVQFAQSVNQAATIYDAQTFQSHIQEDLKIIDQVKPDLIVGDFRLSLSVSARMRKIRYINISNAYWSKNIKRSFPLPESPSIRAMGETLANILMKIFVPAAVKIKFFLMAFELRKSFKAVNIHFNDYRDVITDGDVTLFFDTPGMVKLKNKKPSEKMLGPMIWSSPSPLPAWWSKINPSKKRIFVSFGSSGRAETLPMILSAITNLNVEVIVALAGQKIPNLSRYPNVYYTDFLALDAAMKNSDLVICNGGSPMSHAALAYGVPVIGIVSNNDQLLNMDHIQNSGAGILLRYWNLTPKKVLGAVNAVLAQSKYQEAAFVVQREFATYDLDQSLRELINAELGMNGDTLPQRELSNFLIEVPRREEI